jgi:hypothetical protein
MDLAKYVGAASAPVALIISTSIFLSNLTAKYIPIFSQLRSLTEEIRGNPEMEERVRSLHEQIGLYKTRLRWLMRAVFYLTLSILCFINTVAFTGISMFFPDQNIFPTITIASMFIGLALLALAVILEAWENHLGKYTLGSEMGEGTPSLPDEVRHR